MPLISKKPLTVLLPTDHFETGGHYIVKCKSGMIMIMMWSGQRFFCDLCSVVLEDVERAIDIKDLPLK